MPSGTLWSVWFTSDTHFGHRNIIRYSQRPYRDVAHMTEGLVAAWNDRVGLDDDVWHLGDVAMGALEHSLEAVRRLHGRKHLVPGNHDRCWPHERRFRVEEVRRYEALGFTVHPPQVRLDLGGLDVQACHFPYRGDSHEHDRYVEHRPHDDGSWLLHGHVHEQWRQRGRMLNVGTDAWGWAPVSAAELLELVAAGPRDLDRWGAPAGR